MNLEESCLLETILDNLPEKMGENIGKNHRRKSETYKGNSERKAERGNTRNKKGLLK